MDIKKLIDRIPFTKKNLVNQKLTKGIAYKVKPLLHKNEVLCQIVLVNNKFDK